MSVPARVKQGSAQQLGVTGGQAEAGTEDAGLVPTTWVRVIEAVIAQLRHVQNITSTGSLGDVLLRAGKSETLESLNAAAVTGTLNLFGGKIVSTIVPGVQTGKPINVGKHHVRRQGLT